MDNCLLEVSVLSFTDQLLKVRAHFLFLSDSKPHVKQSASLAENSMIDLCNILHSRYFAEKKNMYLNIYKSAVV